MNNVIRNEIEAIANQSAPDASAAQLSAGSARPQRRQARVLIGWMEKQRGLKVLARPYGSVRDPDLIKRVSDARRVVAERVGTFRSDGAIYDTPEVLNDYLEQLVERPEFAVYRRYGWQVKMADLSKVCAVQEIVHRDHATRRFDDVAPDDLLALAKICLPQEADRGAVSVQWSESDRNWVLTSDNPNLNICAQFSEPQDIGNGRMVPTYGFSAEAQPSFVQVAFHRGRYILRDGYHRALALVTRGVRHMPVLYRKFGEFESLNLEQGNLAEPTYLGDNPASVLDYLDDEVSAETTMSIKKTVIVIEAKRYILSM